MKNKGLSHHFVLRRLSSSLSNCCLKRKRQHSQISHSWLFFFFLMYFTALCISLAAVIILADFALRAVKLITGDKLHKRILVIKGCRQPFYCKNFLLGISFFSLMNDFQYQRQLKNPVNSKHVCWLKKRQKNKKTTTKEL